MEHRFYILQKKKKEKKNQEKEISTHRIGAPSSKRLTREFREKMSSERMN